MIVRATLLLLCVFLAGCVDDAQGCREAHGTWDGVHCSAR
jgi:hypothetical protein